MTTKWIAIESEMKKDASAEPSFLDFCNLGAKFSACAQPHPFYRLFFHLCSDRNPFYPSNILASLHSKTLRVYVPFYGRRPP